jgi:phosphatidate cytidylyltransferase
MSDDRTRRPAGDGWDDEDDDFGALRFADEDDSLETSEQPAITFGPNETGPLPHWSDPPTGELPRLANAPADPTDDLDVWSSFAGQPPAWRDAPASDVDAFEDLRSNHPPAGAFVEEPMPDDPFFDLEEASGAVARVEPPAPPGRRAPLQIDTDPTGGTDAGMRVTSIRSRPEPAGERAGARRSAARTASARPSGRAEATPRAGRDLPTAVTVGLVIAAVFVGLLRFGPPAAMVGFVTVILGLAALEFFDKTTERGYHPVHVVGILGTVAFPLVAYWKGDTALPVVLVLALIAATASFVAAEDVQSGPLTGVAMTTMGLVYIGLMGAYAALIVGFSATPGLPADAGFDTLFIVAAGVVANDVGAYFVGSSAGRSPLREWISPNKTVEGFVGGLAASIMAVLIVKLAGNDTWSAMSHALILAVLIAVLAPLGDLAESMFKRNLDVKDFGTLIRGHGGVLDRFDGFLFVLPAAYYLARVLEPWNAIGS